MRRERTKIEIVGTTALKSIKIEKAVSNGKLVLINNNMITTIENWTNSFGKSFLRYENF